MKADQHLSTASAQTYFAEDVCLPGMKSQASHQLRAARMAVNKWRWQPVKLLYCFPSGADSAVEEELRDMGILVSNGVGIDSLTLPNPPPPPSATNLDVTALCALCSEVCNGELNSPEIAAWASNKPHLKVTHRLYSWLPDALHRQDKQSVLHLCMKYNSCLVLGGGRHSVSSATAFILCVSICFQIVQHLRVP